MKEKISKLFPKEEQQQKVLSFIQYFQQRQAEIKQSYKRVEYVYIHSEFLRTMLGRTSYLQVLEVLVENNILQRTDFIHRTRYKHILHTFKPLKVDESINLFTPTKKRVKNAVKKVSELKKTIDIYSVESAKVQDQFDVTWEDGKKVEGNWSESLFSGRLYNPITSTKKIERHNLRIDKEELVELDVVSCQPTILRNLLEKEGVGQDFIDAFDSTDDVYKTFWDFSKEYNRKEAKGVFYECAFGTTESEHHKTFCSKFPNAGAWLTEIKSIKCPDNPSDKIYSNACRELQLEEVRVFTQVWMSLYDAGIKFAPIHDAVLVKRSDYLSAKKLMENIISKEIPNTLIDSSIYLDDVNNCKSKYHE